MKPSSIVQEALVHQGRKHLKQVQFGSQPVRPGPEELESLGKVPAGCSLPGSLKLSLSPGILVKLGRDELGFRVCFHFWEVPLKPRGSEMVAMLQVTFSRVGRLRGCFLLRATFGIVSRALGREGWHWQNSCRDSGR